TLSHSLSCGHVPLVLRSLLLAVMCFMLCAVASLYLLSFPTRRSSDLTRSSPSPTVSRRSPRPESARSSSRAGPCATSRSSRRRTDRKSTRLNSSHVSSSYAVFCLKKNKQYKHDENYRNCSRANLNCNE